MCIKDTDNKVNRDQFIERSTIKCINASSVYNTSNQACHNCTLIIPCSFKVLCYNLYNLLRNPNLQVFSIHEPLLPTNILMSNKSHLNIYKCAKKQTPTSRNNDYTSMGSSRGGGVKSRPLPSLLENEKIFLLYCGPFFHFSSHGGLFATSFLIKGDPFHHVGAFLLLFMP